jgi:Flavodoxin-like fold
MEYAAARFYFVRKSSRRASFGATLHKQVITTLQLRRLNRAPIAAYADRLLSAEALVLVYPVWNEGFPAIPEGFLRPCLHSRSELYDRRRRRADPELAEAPKACSGLHLRR